MVMMLMFGFKCVAPYWRKTTIVAPSNYISQKKYWSSEKNSKSISGFLFSIVYNMIPYPFLENE